MLAQRTMDQVVRDNNNFQLCARRAINCPRLPARRAEQMVQLYQRQVEQGILAADQMQDVAEKIKLLHERVHHE
jgi:hypothetical protein